VPFPGTKPSCGEVYWIDFDPARGSEQAGRRPAVVVSRDEYNKMMPTVVVAAITSSPAAVEKRKNSPVCVYLPAGSPTPQDSLVLAFQIMTASNDRLMDYIGKLSSVQLTKVKAALAVSFDL
jgi:mRNA interferase MazF